MYRSLVDFFYQMLDYIDLPFFMTLITHFLPDTIFFNHYLQVHKILILVLIEKKTEIDK